MFRTYFELGREHILDLEMGYDHILFIVSLCALYTMRDWKRVLILVTAFTVGHSITLALSALEVIKVNTNWIEFLVPVTIFITAVSNLFKDEENLGDRKIQMNYLYALFFGLIHGMAFSNQFQAILGRNRSIVSQLFAFNIGIEVGQIIIVVIFLTVTFILVDLLTLNRRDWKMVVSSAVAGMALMLIKERWLWD
ncbi:HupE/UreJ family protein [Pseudochryseolinea flava]|uniref:HupE/UreJ family protein n=1 Tax=Pseudochryseolinea flava TaxID=2059302 RepID=A0A364Y8A5_9BACT|nr:HupE/UreJ family protein [Pseudochryseolinea flava]RAW03217.1 HupE/UreJ family protein [Pseudochryseolinea flava]